jgi:signal transduction histidine kinase/CheY-like chemotaxis protein
VPATSRPFTTEVNRRVLAGAIAADVVNENVTKDGRIILCQWHNTPLRDAGGEVIAILSMAQDITARKEAEDQLRRSKSMLADAEQIAHLGSWTFDVSTRRVIWSDEHYRLFGIDPVKGGATYQDGQERIHPEDRPRINAVIEQALTDHKPFECRWRLLMPDGTIRLMHSRGRVEVDGSGNAVRSFGTVQDVTDATRTEEALEAARAAAEAANRAKDEFLAMLGHELRNPLTPILAILQSLRFERRRTLRNERSVIERQARLLSGMVDDLLDVSRIARGKLKLLRRRIELLHVVSRSVEATRPILEEHGHRLRVDVPEALAVNADEGRLVQVVSNLLTNAARYTKRSGLIEVIGRREGRFAVLRVRDNGIGIPNALLAHIFERFTQGPRTIDRGQGGLGLGLSIARDLVLLHGGVLTAASPGAGRGSEFTIGLPLARAKGTRLDRIPAAKPAPRGAATSRSILIVDDNRDITDVLAGVLRARGHSVEVAYDGSTALNLVKRFRPAFALLDIGLPRMSGYEVARRLKRRLGSEAPRLLALTGYGQLSDRKRVLSAGFSDHLVKPLDLERLLTIIEH